MRDIYEKAVAILPPDHIDHHETDLYIKISPESCALVSDYEFRNQVETFLSPLDNCLWFDIPFAYSPTWESRNR